MYQRGGVECSSVHSTMNIDLVIPFSSCTRPFISSPGGTDEPGFSILGLPFFFRGPKYVSVDCNNRSDSVSGKGAVLGGRVGFVDALRPFNADVCAERGADEELDDDAFRGPAGWVLCRFNGGSDGVTREVVGCVALGAENVYKWHR